MNSACHFALGYTKGMSGGDEATFQTVKRFMERGVKNVVVTTDCCRVTFEQLGLREGELLRFVTIPDYWPCQGNVELLLAYARRAIHAWKRFRTWRPDPRDVLICSSFTFANTIPFSRLARRHPPENLYYWIHMPEPRLFYGFEGRLSIPSLKRIVYILQQRLFRFLVRPGATIITPNPIHVPRLTTLLPKNTVYAVKKFGGAEVPPLENWKKEYDLAWMGRFHEQKGIFDILAVAEWVKGTHPDLRVLVIGGGNPTLESKFREEIQRRGLESCVDWKGFITGDERFSLLQRARVFLMPSTFESFGLVILEAMKCGLPVVAYDLPVYHVFDRGMVTVPVGDTWQMATHVKRLLGVETAYSILRGDALDFASRFSWAKTGDEILSLVTEGDE